MFEVIRPSIIEIMNIAELFRLNYTNRTNYYY